MFNLGIYADVRRLYAGQAEAMLQAFVQASAIYRERGIHPLEQHATIFFFPTIREYDFFVDDMRARGCPPNVDFMPASSALRAMLNHAVTVEKTVSNGKNRLFIALQVSPFEGGLRLIDRCDTPLLVMQAVEQAIEQTILSGVEGDNAQALGAMVGGLKVDVTALELNSSRIINKTLASKFFLPFDWLFDQIDRVFASGSGDEFNMMGESLPSETRRLIVQGVEQALLTAFSDNITIANDADEIKVWLRVLMDERLNLLEELEQIGGVAVLDDFHDGTYWTFHVGLKTQTFYNNKSFANVLERTNAEIIER